MIFTVQSLILHHYPVDSLTFLGLMRRASQVLRGNLNLATILFHRNVKTVQHLNIALFPFTFPFQRRCTSEISLRKIPAHTSKDPL